MKINLMHLDLELEPNIMDGTAGAASVAIGMRYQKVQKFDKMFKVTDQKVYYFDCGYQEWISKAEAKKRKLRIWGITFYENDIIVIDCVHS